jgi:hypothetical protein
MNDEKLSKLLEVVTTANGGLKCVFLVVWIFGILLLKFIKILMKMKNKWRGEDEGGKTKLNVGGTP